MPLTGEAKREYNRRYYDKRRKQEALRKKRWRLENLERERAKCRERRREEYYREKKAQLERELAAIKQGLST